MVNELRPVDRAVLAVLGRLLPAAFRERQQGEWASDLLTLPADTRLRYLTGAARTLPSLRAQVRRGHVVPELEVGPGLAAGFARIVFFGLAWPILSWLLWVPFRYYAFSVDDRLAAATDPEYTIDPQSVWPFDVTPGWLMIVWWPPHLGAWMAVLSGPFLIVAVTVFGSLLALLGRRARRRVVLLAAVIVGVVGAAATGVLVALEISDNGFAAGFLGAVALGLTVVKGLSTRLRTGLVVVGLGAIALFVAFHTGEGQAMLGWFQD
ncbi:hypothetical protein [Actinoplanes friuliensis]|uniref:Uncharacterized protein n=1 Tax=Actinoplanes friuliensis DSM 7358 TaxID=1246995 RepID=U5W4I3_9ACTN|nr:hypothetical protein [Actinoplanes friuliensis]AGZ42836.1 hypothetical protein AFR_22830 [Actinoplanes friuliensis DSM 7358]